MRKPIRNFLVLILLLVTGCNLPTRQLQGKLDRTPTAAPPVLNTQDETPFIADTLIPQPAPTDADPLEFDPSRFISYLSQSGDTLSVVAAHFGVHPEEILSSQPLPPQGLLPNNQTLIIPKSEEVIPTARFILPDSEIVNSPCGRNFNTRDFVSDGKGRLSIYTQIVNGRTLAGAEIVRLVSENLSINPRFLLAFIEYRSHWVLSDPAEADLAHPLGLNIPNYEGLFNELTVYGQLVNIGYYGWRQGTLTELAFEGGGSAHIAPALNAGSVGVQYLFARMFSQFEWDGAIYGTDGFLPTYQKMFGDPGACARSIEPLFPDGVQIPPLELPFAAGAPWAFTGGLHADWSTGTPLGALDFAPITGEEPCAVSSAWVLAASPGTVTRSENGVLQIELEDGGGQPTGWELLYMHVAQKDRAPVGSHVNADDPVGHPSCEGGAATGTHVHLARLYRGEWIGAGDPFPLTLSGWLAVAGERPYQSTLVKGDQVVTSDIDGKVNSHISR